MKGPGMSLIVKTIARWVKVLIFLFGVYITLTGHLTPGGGFSGGVIIACLYLMLVLSYGKEYTTRMFPKRLASSLDSFGALIFLLMAILGFWFGGIFFINFLWKIFPEEYFKLTSAGTIIINNIAICIKVSASLFLLFIIMSTLRIKENKDGTKEYIQKEEEE